MPAPKYLLQQRTAIAIALQPLITNLDKNLIVSHWFMGPNQSWNLDIINPAQGVLIKVPMTEVEVEKFDRDVEVRRRIEERTQEMITNSRP